MLWRRHHTQAQAARQAESGKEEDAELRQGRDPARSLHRRVEDGRGLVARAARSHTRLGLDVSQLFAYVFSPDRNPALRTGFGPSGPIPRNRGHIDCARFHLNRYSLLAVTAQNSVGAPRDYLGRILVALQLLSGKTAAKRCKFCANPQRLLDYS